MRNLSFRFFVISLIAVFIISCDSTPEPPKPIDPAFTNYIKGFTGGIVSSEVSIRIRLAEAHPRARMGEEINLDLFDFSPSIDGRAVWVDNQTIEFEPEEKLKSGQTYDGEFELGEIVEVPEKLNTFPFRFQIITQDILWLFEGMEAYQDDQLQWQQLRATVTTTDIAELTDLQECLQASQNGNPLNISWVYSGSNNAYAIRIDSVERTEDAGEVRVSWNGEKIGADTKGEEVVVIPALGDFNLMNVQVDQLPEQKISLFFSDPIDQTQDLNGLIYTVEADEFRIRKDRNAVYLYPAQDISGGRKLLISKSVSNSLGYQLKSNVERAIAFTSMKPEVAFIGDGNILPGKDGFKLPIKAVNLSGVNVKVVKIFEDNIPQFLQDNQFDGSRNLKRVGRVVYKESVSLLGDKPINYAKWNNYELDLTQMVQLEPGAIYRIKVEFDRSQSLFPCDEEVVETKPYQISEAELNYYDSPNQYYWDYYDDFYEYNSEYRYSERENPCKNSYYSRGNHSITTNVLASNLGIIAKSGDNNEMLVALTDLRSAKPISGGSIEVYNYQQQLMETISTDGNGFAKVDLSGKPYLLVAKSGQERGYLRVDDGTALSLSMFDVSGAKNVAGVKGFIYGERGVWRPGDSLYLSFILEDKNQNLPEDHPVIFELYTPENQLFTRQVKSKGNHGFYDLRTATASESPTGNWQAKVKVGNSTFTKQIKIEAIKPNRLKIKFDFDQEPLTADNSYGELSAKWLHGADAGSLRALVEMNIEAGKTKIKGFDKYLFDDPVKRFSVNDRVIFDGNLEEIGTTSINPEVNVTNQAPGMLQLSLKTRVFEKGGDFSVDRFKVMYSPYESYVGVDVPEGEGWNGAIYSNETNLIPIVTVDENGKPVDREGLKVEIFDIYWRWWWERGENDDLARYVNNRSQNLIKSETVNTVNGKALYQLDFNQNLWGRKLIRITDPVSGHTTGETFYVSYRGWWQAAGSNSPGGAEMLSFKTQKQEYKVGEGVNVELPTIEEGRVLVSLESGSKIVQSFWKDASELQNGLSFQTTEEMAPNVYIHLSLVQPQTNTKNNMPIRMYGVQNIEVEAEGTKLNPLLSMPDELTPEGEVEIEVSEADGKAMTYTIAMVDEGLLDLTRFKTPDPWNYFYQREALGVKTWDMYQYVMGAFEGQIAGLLALGGDDALNAGEGNKANRFEPVVKFLGPFRLGSGDEETHRFKMPNYVGSVRTMLIAGDQGAYGSTDKTTPVKKPLMVLATLPRVVSPSEKLKLPVTVFAMEEGIQEVKVELEANALFKLPQKSKTVNFKKVGDQVVYFDLEVKEKIGIGKIKVKVSANGEEARHEIEIQSRLPNPEISKNVSAVVEPGQTWSAQYEKLGIEGTNFGKIEVSSIPPMNLEYRLGYLIRYPHGCIEQTTSSVFPQLYLKDLLDLSDARKSEIDNNIRAAISRLRNFQLYNGAFSYWPGDPSPSSWGTAYAGHFLVLAQKQGYALPDGMIKSWIKYQTTTANTWAPLKTQYNRPYRVRGNQLEQSYRLYSLALAGKPALGAMNRMRELKDLNEIAKWRLAAAYALANKKEVAKSIVAGLKSESGLVERSITYGSRERNDAMILETLVLLDDLTESKRVLDRLSRKLSSTAWLSTQSTAYALYAVANMVKSEGKSKGVQYSLDNGANEISVDVNQSIHIAELDMDEQNILLTNDSDRKLFIQMSLRGTPLTTDGLDASSRLKMEVDYLNMDETYMDPTSIKQGTDFMVEVRITHPGGADTDFEDLALSQLFPSGWEIRNWRMDETNSSSMRDQPDYQDIRDDRVYSYFDLDNRTSKTFRVLLNAAYLGEYYLPAIECSAMYDNEISAVKGGKWVKVVQ